MILKNCGGGVLRNRTPGEGYKFFSGGGLGNSGFFWVSSFSLRIFFFCMWNLRAQISKMKWVSSSFLRHGVLGGICFDTMLVLVLTKVLFLPLETQGGGKHEASAGTDFGGGDYRFSDFYIHYFAPIFSPSSIPLIVLFLS